jgi:hypothetical protein
MPAIDHAAVRMSSPPPAARGALRGWPAPALAALGFAALWLPLTIIAVIGEWRVTWGAPADEGSLLADFIRYGSAISGPLPPQLILVALAFLARRDSRLGLVGTGALGVMGLLIGFNGCASAFSESESAPHAVATVTGLVLAGLGILISVLAARRLLGR